MNKTELARFPVEEGLLDYLQALCYEMDGLRVLNCQLARCGEKDKGYLEEYAQKTAEYEMALNELIKSAAGEYACGRYRHGLDFLTGELVVWEGA